ncbi:integrase core domain-containing protein [Chromatocurvus halotolerans]|uniref:Integrase-like protein n=1 Tax=Chromatocurvus halotolerans TaxID=1132028 RepID=A0A4R2KHA9_9GAMM|nr:integrase core domain-containing protein [Chromatocurvus halotolerans]TCO69869.1 integrase-like protein [Chromatocurvus halotolerans]
MVFCILSLALFGAGYILGRCHSSRWRRDRLACLERNLQLIAARNTIKGFRRKRRRLRLTHWQKWLLGFLHWCSPTLTRYTVISPGTLIRWQRRYVKSYWWLISEIAKSKIAKSAGRPKIHVTIEKLIVNIKKANPGYGAKRITSILSVQLDVRISTGTVRNVLRRNWKLFPPSGPHGQKWLTFLNNHRECLSCMDFKVVFDWRARPLFILSVIDHARRRLVLCRSTYNPTSAWVSQQIREAFPFDEAPAKLLMDNDSIFLPVIENTLPAMGIGVVRTGIKCPWQNGVVERFNRTLTEELLNHIIPISDTHLNRLLREYQRFYNTARPHRANKGWAPEQHPAGNDACYDQKHVQAEAVPWMNGLHHSYQRVA